MAVQRSLEVEEFTPLQTSGLCLGLAAIEVAFAVGLAWLGIRFLGPAVYRFLEALLNFLG